MMAFPNGVVIAGGGIAGASLAILLARRGIRVTMIEKEVRLQPHSSGIFLYSNGLASLERVGVLPAITSAGFAVEDGRGTYLEESGETIVDVVYPSSPGTTLPPILGIKRAVLRQILASEMLARGVDLVLGTEIVDLVDDLDSPSVTVQCSDGIVREADVLIGADGIRSTLRTMLFGPVEPWATGFGVWRSVHARPAAIKHKIIMMGTGKRLGLMPISDDRLYIYATSNEPDTARYDPAQLDTLMLERFHDFSGPARPLLAEITQPGQVVYTAVEEMHLPLPWFRGRVGLIGDAAHASSPFLGQGGAMAIEDAVVLADMLAQGDDVTKTLEVFGRRRQPKCDFVQEQSRRVGEAGGLENTAQLRARNERMRCAAQHDVDSFYRELNSFA